ncbi:WYL domain-containing protein [Actinocrispum wychmicini]|uniref:WYL domain-containing protein n=1 Tax=Actinocrispum wychmicini TaxID=1213861 RepID=UPI00104528D0
MTDTTSRLLALLSLLQTPREWPGSELAHRLQVSPRTIRRDMERLRELGYPVEATMGADGGYRLAAGTAMPPLLLDDEEAVAIAVGLRTAAKNTVHGIEEASVRAMAKLEQVLPSRLRHRVTALSTAMVPLTLSDEPTSVDPEVLTTLAKTISGHERVRFVYRSATGEDTNRLVEPYHLIPTGRRWYLLAHDDARTDWRVFRVDRVTEPWPTGARFTPRRPPTEDPTDYVKQTLFSLAPTYQAVATLHAPIDDITRRLGPQADLEPLDDHSCLLRSHTDTLEWLAFRLIQLGCEFDVHEPTELRRYLADLGARITRSTAVAG